MGLNLKRGARLALAAALALGLPLAAGAPVYLVNGTDLPWKIQFDRQAILKAPVALAEVEAGTLVETGNRIRVEAEPILADADAAFLVLNPGKAMCIRMDNPAGTRLKFPMWIHSRDASHLDVWQYTFQVVSDMTKAAPQARIREFYGSPDYLLPFGMQAPSMTELRLVPPGGEGDQPAGGDTRLVPVLESKPGSSCAIL